MLIFQHHLQIADFKNFMSHKPWQQQAFPGLPWKQLLCSLQRFCVWSCFLKCYWIKQKVIIKIFYCCGDKTQSNWGCDEAAHCEYVTCCFGLKSAVKCSAQSNCSVTSHHIPRHSAVVGLPPVFHVDHITFASWISTSLILYPNYFFCLWHESHRAATNDHLYCQSASYSLN